MSQTKVFNHGTSEFQIDIDNNMYGSTISVYKNGKLLERTGCMKHASNELMSQVKARVIKKEDEHLAK